MFTKNGNFETQPWSMSDNRLFLPFLDISWLPMPHPKVYEHCRKAFLTHMSLRDIIEPLEGLEEAVNQLALDIKTLDAIKNTCYLCGWPSIPKASSLHLIWSHAQNPAEHDQFLQMMHISPTCFQALLSLIENHPTFSDNSNIPQ